MPFLMSEFAKGQEAIIQPQRDALALQYEGATLQDSIQTSHNKAQLSGLQLQQFVTDMKDSAGYKEDLKQLAPSLKTMSPEETTKAIEALAMKHGANPESILKMEELAMRTKEDKARLEALNWTNQQHQFEAISGSIDSMTPDQFRENVGKLKQQMPQDQRIDALFKAANDPNANIDKVKEQAKQALLTEQQRAEVRREAEKEKHDREAEKERREQLALNERNAERRYASMMAGILGRSGDKTEDREAREVTGALGRLSTIYNARDKTKEHDRLEVEAEGADKKLSSTYFFDSSEKKAVQDSRDKLKKYDEETERQQRAVIDSQKNPAVRAQLKEAYPWLYEKSPTKETKTELPKGVPEGSKLSSKTTPDGTPLYEKDGKFYKAD